MQEITRTCRVSGKEFVIDQQDQEFYRKMDVPLPTLCPEERQRRRMSWRNEYNLHYRKCDLCSKQIVSMYDSDSEFTVYCNNCWWSDKWNPLEFGQDFDFSRPFFEQFRELQLKVPRIALHQRGNENSEFTNHTLNCKNCYLCVDTTGEDIYYSQWTINCKDCSDSWGIEDSELCYENYCSVGCYNSKFLVYSDYCVDSAFLYNCKNCENCFMCFNMDRKKFCVYNKQLTEEEYNDFISKVDLGSYQELEKYRKELMEMLNNAPKKSSWQLSCENCTGDSIYKSENVKNSFYVAESEDCRFCYDLIRTKDCYDTYQSGFGTELTYDVQAIMTGNKIRFSSLAWDVSDSDYVDSCHNSKNLFGCISLNRYKHCILNKQYTKEEYNELVSKIVKHMKSTEEWGEFFPISLSPFAYNESVANLYMPLSKNEILEKSINGKKLKKN